MYPGLQEQKGRSESLDCGACIGKACVQSVLTYGTEAWAMKKAYPIA